MSEWEKSIIVQKLRAARVRIRKTEGRCEGRKPYGITPDEQAIIALMREWQREGQTLVQIADRLNREGIMPRTGTDAKWHPTSVRRILVRK